MIKSRDGKTLKTLRRSLQTPPAFLTRDFIFKLLFQPKHNGTLLQCPVTTPYEVSLNLPLRHRCYFIRQMYFHTGKSSEGRGGKEAGSESGGVVRALSFLPAPRRQPRAPPGSAHAQNIGMGHSARPLETHLTPETKGRNHRAFLPRGLRLIFK